MSLKTWIREHVVAEDPNQQQVSTWDRNDTIGTEAKESDR